MTTNAIVRKNELVQLLDVAEFTIKEVFAGKVMKGFKEALGIVCSLRKDFICAVSEIIAKIKSELVAVQKDSPASCSSLIMRSRVSRANFFAVSLTNAG